MSETVSKASKPVKKLPVCNNPKGREGAKTGTTKTMTKPGSNLPNNCSNSKGERPEAGTTATTKASSCQTEDFQMPPTIGNYDLNGQKLGRGSFGRVITAEHKILRMKVAIKMIDTNTSRIKKEYFEKHLHREEQLLAKLSHDNIITLFETTRCGPLYCIITELALGGTLSDSLKDGPLDESIARCYAFQTARALQFMHSQKVVHRDLKVDNIVFKDKSRKHLKIIDFGLANTWNKDNLLKSQCGSPEYAAPELFIDNRQYDSQVDLWSLGIVMYNMVTRSMPFRVNREFSVSVRRKKLLVLAKKGLDTTHEQEMAHLSDNYKNLIRRLLTFEPVNRIRIGKVIQHPLFSNLSVENTDKTNEKEIHDLAVKVIHSVTKISVDEIEEHLVKHKYGKIGGIYNILNHFIQEHGLENITYVPNPRAKENERKPRLSYIPEKVPLHDNPEFDDIHMYLKLHNGTSQNKTTQPLKETINEQPAKVEKKSEEWQVVTRHKSKKKGSVANNVAPVSLKQQKKVLPSKSSDQTKGAQNSRRPYRTRQY